MFKAKDKNNKPIYIDDMILYSKQFCPICGEELKVQNGIVEAKHFTHKFSKTCDSFLHKKSPWVASWIKLFPLKDREVVVKVGEEAHFADALCGNTILKFIQGNVNYKNLLKQSIFYKNTGHNLLWVYNMTDIEPSQVFCWDNITTSKISRTSALSYYLATECGLNCIAYDYGEFVRYITISVDNENSECYVNMEGVSLLKKDFLSCVEKGINPDFDIMEDYINSEDYLQTYVDLITDAAKYQYRDGKITLRDKQSVRNLVNLLFKYVVVSDSGYLNGRRGNSNEWYTPYLENASNSSNPGFFTNFLSKTKYGNPKVEKVLIWLVDAELHFRKYIQ